MPYIRVKMPNIAWLVASDLNGQRVFSCLMFDSDNIFNTH